jgi:hypothetical protein
MKKFIFFLLMVCFAKTVSSQVPDTLQHPIDSVARRDSILIQETKENLLDNIPEITMDDNEFGGVGDQNISSVLTAGRDPFYNAASFNFFPTRFRIRGYDNDLFAVYMNGIPMDNIDNGYTPFSTWGGLNDVMRNRDVSLGLRPSTFAFGDIGSSTSIDARASKQRKQTKFSYSISNRNYVHRWMLTHNSGISKHGWAFSLSGSRRWADEGYVPGTYYDGWSYFAGIDKRFGQKDLLSFIAFGAPTEYGRQGAALEEMVKLSGTHYYNPYWGFQNGKKRNANVAKNNQPVFILTNELRIGNKTSLITSAGYMFGNRNSTALDWYNAPDPRPDYYRYLPSYYAHDSAQYAQLEEMFSTDLNARQINWQNLYNVNRDSWETIHNANGIEGNDVTGKRSRYILSERAIHTDKLMLNAVINSSLNENVSFMGGFSYQSQRNHYYQKVDDLLGGEFYVDYNQFAERDFPNNTTVIQNDLNNPNRIVYEGDKYGYNYAMDIHKAAGWMQMVYTLPKVDFFVAGELSYTEFWRVGKVRNGLFPEQSYGKSDINRFNNYSVKGGITYKINGRNYVYVNAAYLTRAPYFENVYLSPRTRDSKQSDISSETINTFEGGYILNAPAVKLRLSGYYTRMLNGMNVLSFYHDQYQNFVNYALSNIDRVYFGGELGVEANLMRNVTVNAAASLGRYYYDSRQHAVVTVDNSAEILTSETIYSNNYRVPSTPQEAYSLGFTYNSPHYWFASLTGNYFNKMWLDFNPLRRTYTATEGVEKNSQLWDDILNQREFDSQFTLDFFGGYSYKLPKPWLHRPVFLVLNIGVSNILNNKDIITGGYEQLRFDFADKNVNKFPPKLYYAYGINYFISASIRF